MRNKVLVAAAAVVAAGMLLACGSGGDDKGEAPGTVVPTSTRPLIDFGGASKRPTTAAPVPTRTTVRPKPKPKPTAEPEPEEDVYYANCAAVQAAGAAPIHRGDPGYSRRLDRDGDGVGCAGD